VTTTPMDDAELGSALALLWRSHRQSNLDRISLLESITAEVLRGTVDDAGMAEGQGAAHKLAGSLGTFGFDAGSRAALHAESLLREPVVDGRLLAEAVTALRASVAEVASPPEGDPGSPGVAVPGPGPAAPIQLVSTDIDLISRLTVEASSVGLIIASVTDMPSSDPRGGGLPAMVVIDESALAARPHASVLASVTELARSCVIVVLTERDGLQDRADLATAGVVGVIPRSQGARQTIAFVNEELIQLRPAPRRILALNVTDVFAGTLTSAFSTSSCEVEVHDDPTASWAALEESGADLIAVGALGPVVSGPNLCRVIRAHPRWKNLPVVVVGEMSSASFGEALSAGADDYLPTDISATELSVRLYHRMERARLAQSRTDVDPLTGAGNRTSTEGSLDRMLRLSARQDAPFSVAMIAVDQIAQIREAEGNAVCDVVLRRLGTRLIDAFRGEDVVGRWTDDGFAVGIYGATGEQASDRLVGVLASFAAEGIPTTSGSEVRCTFSAGIASSPTDGSTLGSLQRLCESALQRAMVSRNCVLMANDRAPEQTEGVLDVVLIEDDDSVADVIEHALTLRHYRFVRFSDGAEAAAALGEGRVKGRVVLLDVGLPSLDGFGVLQVMRNQNVLDDTRVIMLTARSSEAEMLRALGLGAMEHITKPFSVPVLLGRLDQTLSRSVV
jgi:diguanylate cyclase (GGDEF)-like protein